MNENEDLMDKYTLSKPEYCKLMNVSDKMARLYGEKQLVPNYEFPTGTRRYLNPFKKVNKTKAQLTVVLYVNVRHTKAHDEAEYMFEKMRNYCVENGYVVKAENIDFPTKNSNFSKLNQLLKNQMVDVIILPKNTIKNKNELRLIQSALESQNRKIEVVDVEGWC